MIVLFVLSVFVLINTVQGKGTLFLNLKDNLALAHYGFTTIAVIGTVFFFIIAIVYHFANKEIKEKWDAPYTPSQMICMCLVSGILYYWGSYGVQLAFANASNFQQVLGDKFYAGIGLILLGVREQKLFKIDRVKVINFPKTTPKA